MNLAQLAFATIEKELIGKVSNFDERFEVDSANAPQSPLFVTWKLNGELRGCIGTFTPLSLYTGVKTYALIAAFKDPRFEPINAKELPKLSCTVTVLTPSTPMTDYTDFEIGVDGVKAYFRGNKTSTFLPEVAEEQGWSKRETFEMLARKAGSSLADLQKMEKYQGLKHEMTYKEYIL